jgi:long-chain acyl-CoA synthetase
MTGIDIVRPWLDNYPPGVPAKLDENEVGTLLDIYDETMRRYGSRPALESFGVRMSYAELGATAEKIAVALQVAGLKKGDRVAIMMPNVMAYPPVIFGILLAGGVVVNVNPLYTPRELRHQLNDSGAKMIFVLENFAHTLAECLDDLPELKCGVLVSPGDLMGFKGHIVNFVSRHIKKAVKPFALRGSVRFRAFLAWAKDGKLQRPEVSRDDIAFLQYTGGTTGVSKGAILLHRNIASNVMQCEAWLKPFLNDRTDHVMYTALPLYHILALTACNLFMFRLGAMQVLIANPRDIPAFIKTLQKTPPSILVLVNTLYNVLSHTDGFSSIDFSKLDMCISGGMATQAAVAQRWKELTGKPIIEGYGLSETSPLVCVNRLDITDFTGTIGMPAPSTDVSVRAPDGNLLPAGEPGELCVRGPQVMAGYWQRPDETEKVMTPDGFFKTGDVAIMLPDGQFKIVDRMKDMIAVSGLKVFPNEVEDVLASHPKVLEAAVIGIPDEHSGEAVAAYIVRKDMDVTVDEIRAYAREKLAAYKVPKSVEFRETLPKTNVGKILRRELRDEVVGKSANSQAA